MKIHHLIKPLAALCLFAACKKDEYVGKDPYADAKEQIAIKLSSAAPSPASGTAGSTVSLSGTGFLKYKDSIRIKFNGEPAENIEILDSLIRVKVPAMASSGIITPNVGKDVFPGPSFTVNGAVSVDKSFQSFVGANNVIASIAAMDDGRFALAGSFTDYNNAGVRAGYSGLVVITADGAIDKSFKIAPGFNGDLQKVIQLRSGQLLTVGSFTKFANMRAPVGNIAVLQRTGSMPYQVYGYTNQNGDPSKDTVPSFNAFFDGPVTGAVQQEDGRIIVHGNFRHYLSKTWYPAGKDTIITDSVRAGGLVRLFPDGRLDKDYNYDAVTGQVVEGVNGYISDAVLQADGKLLLAGSFTKYKGTNVRSLIRLLPDGSLDEAFTAGNGLNGDISSARLMPDNKILVTGTFSQIGGKTRKKIALLNEDGAAFDGFDAGTGADGPVHIAARLGNGKILVAGTFQKFNGINRYGLAILEADGALSRTHNNVGGFGFKETYFSRPVNDILTIDQFSSVIVGNFNKVDLLQNNRIVRISY